MPERGKSMGEMLGHIVRTRTEMVRILAGDDFPVPAPPASATMVARAEARFGLTFPPSYRAFLAEANGIRDFADEIDLLSVGELLSPEYDSWEKEMRRLGWEVGERVVVEGLIIGSRQGNHNVILLDRTVAPDERGELPVVYWKYETGLRAASLTEFLDQWCGVVDELLAGAREMVRETPPGGALPPGPAQG
jgi:hypothetical protein